jgi:hypothetical protein
VRPRRAGRLVYYAVDDQHILELLKQASTHVEEPRLATPDSRHASVPDPSTGSGSPRATSRGEPRTATREPRPANRAPRTANGRPR